MSTTIGYDLKKSSKKHQLAAKFLQIGTRHCTGSSSKHFLMAHEFLGFQKTCIVASLLTEEEVWEEIGHILIKLILRGQQHRLVVDEQQQQVEEEQQHNASQHHQDGRNAVLLGNDTCLGIQWLQQVRQTCANTIALWQWVALSIGCGLLGVANREVASFRRHAHLTSLAARIHEAHLAGQQAQAAQQQRRPAGNISSQTSCFCRLRVSFVSVSNRSYTPKIAVLGPRTFAPWQDR